MEKLGVSVTEAAEIVGIGRTKGFELCAKGEWPVIRVGRRVIIPVDGLRSWMQRQARQAGEPAV